MFGVKENTEEKIIKATFDILQKERVQKATTKKIAAEAGVNEVTIFRKFENKKNLVEITIDYYMERLLGKLEECFSYVVVVYFYILVAFYYQNIKIIINI